jgi:hypothetical protein
MIDVRLTGRAWSRFLAGVAAYDWGIALLEAHDQGCRSPPASFCKRQRARVRGDGEDIVSRS